VRDVILQGPIDIFEAIAFDLTERIDDILNRDPQALNRPFGDYATCESRRSWCTPLALAVIQNRAHVVRLLVDRGADLSGAPDGRTLQDLAKESGREQVADVLKRYMGSERE
jgi:hypothetical protein